MARRCEMLLLMLVLGASCRRPAPPPPPAAVEPAPPPNVVPLPPPTAETPPATTGAEGAARVEGEAAKSKEAAPAKAATRSGGSDEIAARTRATRVATEQQRPKTKHHGAGAQAAKTAEGQVVAAREDVAAPQSAVDAPARATLRFKNEAGNNYKLVEARFVMDGAELPTVITSAQRGEAQQIFSGSLPAGRHVVASRLTYQGADRAIFSYMKGYTFRVQSDDEFVARGKDAVSMTIVCKEKTGFNTPVERRLFVTVE